MLSVKYTKLVIIIMIKERKRDGYFLVCWRVTQRNEPGMGMEADLAHRLVTLRPRICKALPEVPARSSPEPTISCSYLTLAWSFSLFLRSYSGSFTARGF